LGPVAAAQAQFLAWARLVEELLVVAVVSGYDAVAREPLDAQLRHARQSRR
jgi:hypothetical protein